MEAKSWIRNDCTLYHAVPLAKVSTQAKRWVCWAFPKASTFNSILYVHKSIVYFINLPTTSASSFATCSPSSQIQS